MLFLCLCHPEEENRNLLEMQLSFISLSQMHKLHLYLTSMYMWTKQKLAEHVLQYCPLQSYNTGPLNQLKTLNCMKVKRNSKFQKPVHDKNSFNSLNIQSTISGRSDSTVARMLTWKLALYCFFAFNRTPNSSEYRCLLCLLSMYI